MLSGRLLGRALGARATTVLSGPSSSQRRSMFIQVQDTPNPLCLKFLPGQAVLGPDKGKEEGS